MSPAKVNAIVALEVSPSTHPAKELSVVELLQLVPRTEGSNVPPIWPSVQHGLRTFHRSQCSE